MPMPSAARPILSLYNRLYRHYGPQHWWPASSTWEMMVGAILTQNTAWTNVERALSALKEAKALSVEGVASMPRRHLETLIRSSGYFRQKAHRLQLFARAYAEDPSFIHDRARLLAQHGVGPETADSILLYAAKKPVFVIDAYTRRLGHRLGWFKTDNYRKVQAYFEGRLPKDAALYNEFHALIVRLAKEVCVARRPRCGLCPVQSQCAYGRRQPWRKPSSFM